jgi:hypothetical protein
VGHRISVCRKLKQQARDDPNFIYDYITCDEIWVYDYVPETEQQSSQWKAPNSPRPKKAREVRSNAKSVLIVFSDIQGIVNKEFIPPSQTVHGQIYCEVFKRLMEGIRRKRPDKWKNNCWFLHHDNAPAHTSLVPKFLSFKNITVIPPIRLTSPPCDIFLFPKMKLRLKGRRFCTAEDIHAESQNVIDTLTFENFQGSMKSWGTRWDRCIHAQGPYFQGASGNWKLR